MARLSDSVAPLVKTISFGAAPIRLPMFLRAWCTAASASQPNACLLAELPNCSVKNGSMASTTRGSTGVVAWLSKYTGSFTELYLQTIH